MDFWSALCNCQRADLFHLSSSYLENLRCCHYLLIGIHQGCRFWSLLFQNLQSFAFHPAHLIWLHHKIFGKGTNSEHLMCVLQYLTVIWHWWIYWRNFAITKKSPNETCQQFCLLKNQFSLEEEWSNTYTRVNIGRLFYLHKICTFFQKTGQLHNKALCLKAFKQS